MAEFNLNSINIIFSGGQMSRIDASFNKRDDNRRNNINGNVELSVQEYLENASSSDQVNNLVRQKAIDFLDQENEEEPEETEEGTDE